MGYHDYNHHTHCDAIVYASNCFSCTLRLYDCGNEFLFAFMFLDDVKLRFREGSYL